MLSGNRKAEHRRRDFAWAALATAPALVVVFLVNDWALWKLLLLVIGVSVAWGVVMAAAITAFRRSSDRLAVDKQSRRRASEQ